VATAVSPRAGSSAPAASVAAADRPIERPDMSADEKLELSQPWYACEEQAGIKMLRDDKGRRTRPADLLGSVRLRRNADKKCANLLPEELSEHAQRTDPHYLDKFDRWLSCAKSHGVDVHEAPGNPGMLEFPKALPPPDQHQALDKCEMEAFSGS
jgi:hypothetical protein